jgi:hypothetical protein
LIHPAGLGFFGQVMIKRCAKSDLHNSTSLTRFEVPIIGHYEPYTMLTYDDLANWFMFNGTHAGYEPGVHDPLIITHGNCNPISNGIEFHYYSFILGATSDSMIGLPMFSIPSYSIPEYEIPLGSFTSQESFWIIYHHPNTRIDTPVIARIDYQDRDMHVIISDYTTPP